MYLKSCIDDCHMIKVLQIPLTLKLVANKISFFLTARLQKPKEQESLKLP
jgi:hypothetical protein